jgi:hypothetical protein
VKLYRVRVEVEFYMMAENERSAHRFAEDFAEEALRDDSDTVAFVAEVTNLATVSPEWRESLPYGGDGETTVAEILVTPTPPTKGAP